MTDPEVTEAVNPVTLPTVYAYVPFGSENTIVLVPEDFVLPAKVTDHEVPLGRPVSVNVTAYSAGGIAVKVMGTVCARPETPIDPDAGVAVYPVTEPTVYGYVPFASVNTIAVVVEDRVVPLRVTDQDVPLGRPASVNLTVY